MKLDQKQSSWDSNWHFVGVPCRFFVLFLQYVEYLPLKLLFKNMVAKLVLWCNKLILMRSEKKKRQILIETDRMLGLLGSVVYATSLIPHSH